MQKPEDSIAMARRYVRAGEALVNKQLNVVVRKARDGRDASEAEGLLRQFVDCLGIFQRHLAQMEGRAHGRHNEDENMRRHR